MISESETHSNVPIVRRSQVYFGDLKGFGSFSNVYEVKSMKKPKKEPYAVKILNCCKDFKLGTKKTVVKLPKKPDGIDGEDEGIVALKNEARILSILKHENIIQIHGRASMEHINNFELENKPRPFFIILDCLKYTLYEKIEEMAASAEVPKDEGMMTADEINDSFFEETPDEKVTPRESIDILISIASAMKYLHGLNIIHRDIKTENIGFDSNGTLKVFDFGLAVDLDYRKKQPDGTYNLEGGVGTCRFMPPEIASFEPYNQLADVYSFGIVMYSLLALKKPFHGLTMKKWAKTVVVNGKRPSLRDIRCSTAMKCLIRRCWDQNWSERPTFENIYNTLQDERKKQVKRMPPLLVSLSSSSIVGPAIHIQRIASKRRVRNQDSKSKNA